MTNYKNQTSASARPEREDAADKRSESLNIMKLERPISMKQEGYISPKGPGATLNKYVRPARPNKILY